MRASIIPSKRDWQQIGRDLRDEWLVKEAALPNLITNTPWLEELFIAVEEYTDGKPTRLIDYLRSDRPFDRGVLAFFLLIKSGGPSPKGHDMRMITDRADTFYREWRARNKSEGINDRGLSDSMKYQSCVYLIEMDVTPYWEHLYGGRPDPDAMMDLLARPKSRRKYKPPKSPRKSKPSP